MLQLSAAYHHEPHFIAGATSKKIKCSLIPFDTPLYSTLNNTHTHTQQQWEFKGLKQVNWDASSEFRGKINNSASLLYRTSASLEDQNALALHSSIQLLISVTVQQMGLTWKFLHVKRKKFTDGNQGVKKKNKKTLESKRTNFHWLKKFKSWVKLPQTMSIGPHLWLEQPVTRHQVFTLSLSRHRDQAFSLHLEFLKFLLLC